MSVTFPKGHRSQWQELVAQCRGRDDFDVSKEAEIQTDKDLVKVLPCQFCRRPLVVTTFYVLAWAKCGPCKGEASGSREAGSVQVAQSGRTEPRLVADLTKVLINPTFARALCPVHPDNDDHVMELKSVHWSDAYGPHEYRMIDGKLLPVQIAPGETVMHQCQKCKAVVSYTTTAVTQFKRINEPKQGKNANINASTLGTRDSGLDDWRTKVADYPPPVSDSDGSDRDDPRAYPEEATQ